MKSEPPLPVFDTSCCNISVYFNLLRALILIIYMYLIVDFLLRIFALGTGGMGRDGSRFKVVFKVAIVDSLDFDNLR